MTGDIASQNLVRGAIKRWWWVVDIYILSKNETVQYIILKKKSKCLKR
jgi:hypothetical protein